MMLLKTCCTISAPSQWCVSPFRTTGAPLTSFVIQDNHDADAFIKPVSRADVPDYYDSTFSFDANPPMLTPPLSHNEPHGLPDNG